MIQEHRINCATKQVDMMDEKDTLGTTQPDDVIGIKGSLKQREDIKNGKMSRKNHKEKAQK